MSFRKYILTFILFIYGFSELVAQTKADYIKYHQNIVKAENLISHKNYSKAFSIYEHTFNSYDFVFLRDYKVATQLALFLKNEEKAYELLKLAISNGWTLKGIKKNKFLKPLRGQEEWKNINSEYKELRKDYSNNLNQPLKAEVQEMYKKDQRMALRALFKIGQKSKIIYAENKFAPHSEKQLAQLNEIFNKYGYPGEQLIGNNWWASVILSHHNSISEHYNSKDTIYSKLKPKLIVALKRGEISPYYLAIIEDWRIAVLNKHNLTSYGFLGKIQNDSILEIVNKNRREIGLRSIELRNSLLDIEKETGLNLYLPRGWQKGNITVANNG